MSNFFTKIQVKYHNMSNNTVMTEIMESIEETKKLCIVDNNEDTSDENEPTDSESDISSIDQTNQEYNFQDIYVPAHIDQRGLQKINNEIYNGARIAAGPFSPMMINEGLNNRKMSERTAKKGMI